jgi:pimeloyl-ACP methyl ester carboxylesterase
VNLLEHIQALPTKQRLIETTKGQALVRYREAGPAQGTDVPLVLLHGIGSGSASWVYQLDTADAGNDVRVLAWDAPGYADSTSLPASIPLAQDYAQTLWVWLDAQGIEKVHLVGHSLGCLMAASAARLQPQRVAELALLAPAQGYGLATPEVRSKMVQERIGMFTQLGSQKLAQARGPALLTPHTHPEHLALAVHMMSGLHAAGYAQATHMLAHADIMVDLRAFLANSEVPITVACGELDTVTPAKACRALALAIGAHYVSLGDVGHLCALQASAQVNDLLGLGRASPSTRP